MSKKEVAVNGQKLVADYQSVMLALATTQAATYEAERSEAEVLSHLAATSSGGYLNPGNMDQSMGENIAKASLDTHVKKIQAEQIKNLSTAKVESISEEDKSDYVGKKVNIKSIDKDYLPFESVWFDNQYGYRNYDYKKSAISGKIEEILIEKNALVVKPNLIRRILVRDLKFFVVYVINPNTLEPAVSIDIA